jgi:hypothetical protein
LTGVDLLGEYVYLGLIGLPALIGSVFPAAGTAAGAALGQKINSGLAVVLGIVSGAVDALRAFGPFGRLVDLIVRKANELEEDERNGDDEENDEEEDVEQGEAPRIEFTEEELNQAAMDMTDLLRTAVPAVVQLALSIGGTALLRVGNAILRIFRRARDFVRRVLVRLRRLFRVCRGCFVAGTPTATEHGVKPIESVERGERVWGRDERTGEWQLAEVEWVHRRTYSGEFVTVHAGGEELTATAEHPFWVVSGAGLADRPIVDLEEDTRTPGVEGRWVSAEDLQVGDLLATRDGVVEIEGLQKEEAERVVYNLQVSKVRTYNVGRCGAWVHNTSRPRACRRRGRMRDRDRGGRNYCRERRYTYVGLAPRHGS